MSSSIAILTPSYAITAARSAGLADMLAAYTRWPAASWPSALRATSWPPPSVAPHRLQSAAPGVGLPFSTSGGRFCRTLYTASPGAGTPCPQIPILARPDRSITRLATPDRSAAATWPSCS